MGSRNKFFTPQQGHPAWRQGRLRGARHWLESLYTTWLATLLEGFRAGLEARKRDPPRILLGCGMGGSAYSIAAAGLALEEHGYSVMVWRGHKLLRLWALAF